MKKLNKRSSNQVNTIKAYACSCPFYGCYCSPSIADVYNTNYFRSARELTRYGN